MTIEEYIPHLEKLKGELRKRVMDAQQTATQAAVNMARQRTAPNDGIPRGENMVTGNMNDHWESDSKVIPVDRGDSFATELNCKVSYASYVNHGHWLYRHFVPGLYIDGNQLISRTYKPGIGLIVAKGGKKWVQGRFMEDAAIKEYRDVLQAELRKVGEIWK